MAEESGRGVALAILGIVAVIAIVGLVLLFSGAKKTGQAVAGGGDKIYGGALKDAEYPYLEGRTIKGGVAVGPEGVQVSDEMKAYSEGIPYRTFNRVPDQIPTTQTACGIGYAKVDFNAKLAWENDHPGTVCTFVSEVGGYCCTVPEFENRQ